MFLIPFVRGRYNHRQSLLKYHFDVKRWAFDIANIKSYLLNDADTAHIGFAFSDVLSYTS